MQYCKSAKLLGKICHFDHFGSSNINFVIFTAISEREIDNICNLNKYHRSMNRNVKSSKRNEKLISDCIIKYEPTIKHESHLMKIEERKKNDN